jgi:hypothetical protein
VGCTLLWQSWMIFEKRPRQTCPFRERAVHIDFEACVRLAFHVGEGGPYVLRQRAVQRTIVAPVSLQSPSGSTHCHSRSPSFGVG